jgi:hypothetical protein
VLSVRVRQVLLREQEAASAACECVLPAVGPSAWWVSMSIRRDSMRLRGHMDRRRRCRVGVVLFEEQFITVLHNVPAVHRWLMNLWEDTLWAM